MISKFNISSAFKNQYFKLLFLTVVFSNIGNKMHETGAAWLMISLTSNPIWIALIQTTHAFSISIFALVAGVLADIIDRRFYLLILQIYMFFVAIILAILNEYTQLSPEALFVTVLLLDVGTALTLPTWQSLFPELVPKSDLKSAVLLNTIAINVPRIIGPAIAGLIIAKSGPTAVFILNGLTFVGLILTLLIRPKVLPEPHFLPAEKFWGAMKFGIRYVKEYPLLHRIMYKSILFFFFTSSLWSLFPLIARKLLNADPYTYGCIYASFGLGAVISAFLVPQVRKYVNIDKLIMICSFVYFTAIQLIINFQTINIAYLVMLMCGISWALVTSSFNISIQENVPNWIRARALSIYYMVFYGGIALGGVFWGVLANASGVVLSLKIASSLLIIINIIAAYFLKINEHQKIDYTPINKNMINIEKSEIQKSKQPILVAIEYSIAKHNHFLFKKSIKLLRQVRLREGAYFWTLLHDVNDSNRFIESFMIESWVEHLRYQHRFSKTHKDIQMKVFSYHEGLPPVENILVSVI